MRLFKRNRYYIVNNNVLLERTYNATAAEKEAIILGQLREIWSSYGDLVELWFDGGTQDPALGKSDTETDTATDTQRQTHSDRQVHALGLIASEDIDALLCRVQDPAAAARAAAEGSVFPRPNAHTRDTMGRERVWPCRPSELVRIHCAQKCDRTDISR